MLSFKPAQKKQSKARIALIGPSGSGKTFTALRIAGGLTGRVAVVDTEHGSASKYADQFQFDVMELQSFHPDLCVQAIRAAESSGYDVLIIDSLSHFWFGKDGELELVDKFAKKYGQSNSFAGWKDVTPIHNTLIDAILGANLHIIATMRSKTEWVIEKDERTQKNTPRKIGLAPVFKDNSEYEFDLVGYLDEDNLLVIKKSRCPQLTDYIQRHAGEDLAYTIRAWLSDGAPMETLSVDGSGHHASEDLRGDSTDGMKVQVGPSREDINELLKTAALCDEMQEDQRRLNEAYEYTSAAEYFRMLFEVGPETTLSNRFYREHLTAELYQKAREYFDGLIKVLKESEDDVPTDPAVTTLPQGETSDVENIVESTARELIDLARSVSVEPSPEPQRDTKDSTYADEAQIATLKHLAQRVGDDAYADVQDLIDHNPNGIVLTTYELVKHRLNARLEANKDRVK